MSTNTPESYPADTPGELAPAGVLSRIGKFAVGSLQLAAVWSLLANPRLAVADQPVENTSYWIIVALAFVLLPTTVNVGFNRAWGRKPLIIGLVALAASAVLSRAIDGVWWGPPPAFVAYATSVYVHGHMGLSHVLASVVGTPGCEMRVIAQLWSRLRGKNAEFAPCPGFWTPLDNWEAALRSRLGSPR